jgi:hypothetical protein
MNRSDDRFWASQVALMRKRHPELFCAPARRETTKLEPSLRSGERADSQSNDLKDAGGPAASLI